MDCGGICQYGERRSEASTPEGVYTQSGEPPLGWHLFYVDVERMTYKMTYDGVEYRFKNKDDMIWQIAIWLGGDGSTEMKIVYPDGWVLIE